MPISPEDRGATDLALIAPFPPPSAPGSIPVIDVWYGDNQTFGANGIPQQWVNILGTVISANPISSLTYSLNGGSPQPLAPGTQYPRLVEPGDFNVEMDYASLNPGANTVTIVATDNQGNRATHTVTVNYVSGQSWLLPYSIDWSTVGKISDVAQIVDGKWELQPDGTVRTMQTGYDRLIAIGDMNNWSQYEVAAEVTVHTAVCDDFGIGIVTGWKGHTTVQYGQTLPDQPRTGHPFFGLGWWTNEVPGVPAGTSSALEIYTNTPTHPETILASKPERPTFGVKYMFKFRVENNTIGGSHYSFKVWVAGTPEPQNWDLQADGELNRGSILLATHRGDVSFGAVSITPIP